MKRGGPTDAQRVARFEQLWQELFPRVLGYALRRMDPEEALRTREHGSGTDPSRRR